MGKLSGKSGRIKLETAATISAATFSAGVATITVDTTANLRAGGFVLISGVVGMVELNNDGKGHLVTEITDGTTFKVAIASGTTYVSGGSAQRIIPIIVRTPAKGYHPVLSRSRRNAAEPVPTNFNFFGLFISSDRLGAEQYS